MSHHRVNYVSNIRGLAILFVVLVHCVSALEWNDDSIFPRILSALFPVGLLLFILIAGFVFQYHSHKYSYRVFLKSKCKNVLAPYFFMSIPAIIYYTLFAQRPGMEYVNDWPLIFKIVEFYLVGGHLVPYWFIPMMFIHYVLSPLYIYADKKLWLYYSLPLFFIISLFVWKGGAYQIYSYLHFAFVFFLGMFLCKERVSCENYLKRTDIILILIILAVFLGYFEIKTEYQSLLNKRINFVKDIIQCLIYFGLFIRFDSIIGNRLEIFSAMSFGIYFVHSYFISGFKLAMMRVWGELPVGNFFIFIIFYLAILCISMATIVSFKRIFGEHSRIVCGS